MNLFINDQACAASPGQTLGKAARLNHSHVGYVCGGHGVCQACYVTVQAGAECLSPLSDIEKAFLSDRQQRSGGRLACQATLERDGTVRVLSRPEEVRRLLFSNPPGLFAYGAQMGQDVITRIVPGVSNLAGRVSRREIGTPGSLGDLLESAGAALQCAFTMLPQMIPFREQAMGFLSMLPSIPLPTLPFTLPSLPLPFKLPFFGSQEPLEQIERVQLTVGGKSVPSVPAASPAPAPSQTAAPVKVSVSVKQQPPGIDVAALEGIREEHASRLVKAGVKNFDTLLDRGRERSGRKELSGSTGISEEDVLTLVNRADLARVKGIGFAYSELLEVAGVDTVPELAQRNPANLHAKMQEVNALKNLVHQLPSLEQVTSWVEQAKQLPRIINY
jgi:chlorosome envelope protein I